MIDTHARAVQFQPLWRIDVPYLADVRMPETALGEVLAAVRAAGINPGEAAIRSRAMDELFPQASRWGRAAT